MIKIMLGITIILILIGVKRSFLEGGRKMKTRVLKDKEIPVHIADIRVYRDSKNQLWYSAEDIAKKFGLVHLWLKNAEFYYRVHWQTVNKLLKSLGYDIILTENSFITEDVAMALSKKLQHTDIIKLINRLQSQDMSIPDFKNIITTVKRNIILLNRVKLVVISKVKKGIFAGVSGAVISGVTKVATDIRKAVATKSRDSPVQWASHL